MKNLKQQIQFLINDAERELHNGNPVATIRINTLKAVLELIDQEQDRIIKELQTSDKVFGITPNIEVKDAIKIIKGEEKE